MKCKYDVETALALAERARNGESLRDLHSETGISIPTLWRWKNGISLPHEKQYNDNKDYYRKNKERVIETTKRNKLHGNYLKALRRDNYRCTACSRTKYLVVHHRDANRKNDDLNNLITLCQKCHNIVHNPLNRKELTTMAIEKGNLLMELRVRVLWITLRNFAQDKKDEINRLKPLLYISGNRILAQCFDNIQKTLADLDALAFTLKDLINDYPDYV